MNGDDDDADDVDADDDEAMYEEDWRIEEKFTTNIIPRLY